MPNPSPSEKSRLNDSLVLVSKVPLTLCWRNNVGMAWQGEGGRVAPGQMIRTEPGLVVLRKAWPITFSVPGSPDIMGVTAGAAWGIEMKDDRGRQSAVQQNFQVQFERCGGRYMLSRSAADSRAFVEAIRRGEG